MLLCLIEEKSWPGTGGVRRAVPREHASGLVQFMFMQYTKDAVVMTTLDEYKAALAQGGAKNAWPSLAIRFYTDLLPSRPVRPPSSIFGFHTYWPGWCWNRSCWCEDEWNWRNWREWKPLFLFRSSNSSTSTLTFTNALLLYLQTLPPSST